MKEVGSWIFRCPESKYPGGKGVGENCVFPVAESSESTSVANRGVRKKELPLMLTSEVVLLEDRE